MSATYDDLRIPPKPLRITLRAAPRLSAWRSLPIAAFLGFSLGCAVAGLLG